MSPDSVCVGKQQLAHEPPADPQHPFVNIDGQTLYCVGLVVPVISGPFGLQKLTACLLNFRLQPPPHDLDQCSVPARARAALERLRVPAPRGPRGYRPRPRRRRPRSSRRSSPASWRCAPPVAPPGAACRRRARPCRCRARRASLEELDELGRGHRVQLDALLLRQQEVDLLCAGAVAAQGRGHGVEIGTILEEHVLRLEAVDVGEPKPEIDDA